MIEILGIMAARVISAKLKYDSMYACFVIQADAIINKTTLHMRTHGT